jgi:hypothetical protein
MSDDAVRLLDAFAALPPSERYAVFVEMARFSETNAGAISDEELAHAGEELFSMYDSEEAEHGDTQSR